MALTGTTLRVRGEVASTEDIIIEGRLEQGPLWCEGQAVTVASTASIAGDIVARSITVFGAVAGLLLATDVVTIRESATVTGRVIAPRLTLENGAWFQGSVEPQRLDTALSVARHRRTNT